MQARELLTLAEDCLKDLPPAAQETFWTELRDRALQRQPLPLSVRVFPPMTDDESREFGDTRMEYGLHQGERLDDVPMSYLCWLADNAGPFADRLRRYIPSRRVAREAIHEPEVIDPEVEAG